MSAEPSTGELELVARHGSNDLTRALATVQLAKRRGRLDDLRELAEAEG